MASKTIKQFLQSLRTYPNRVQRRVLNAWNKQTFLAGQKAKELSPFTLGGFSDSIRNIQAKITPGGVESSLLSSIPYARMLETGFRENRPIRLKDEGEISYYINGRPVMKRRKGEIGAMQKGVDSVVDPLVKELQKIIAQEWTK